MSLETTHTTQQMNISLKKGEYKSISFEAPFLAGYGSDTLSWWGLYVRPYENGPVIAETSKDTDTANVTRTEWTFSSNTVTIFFYEDFSFDLPPDSSAKYFDVLLIDTAGRRWYPIAGTFEFTATYTRDDDTHFQIWTDLETIWENGICSSLEVARQGLIDADDTGAITNADHEEGDTDITILGGDPTLVFLAGDPIGIELDTGAYHESTVTGYVNALEYTIADALPSAASLGNAIYKGGPCNHERCGT